jgi:hypothetical protein
MDVFPVPGAPVITTLLFPKDLELKVQSNEIATRKKN